MPAQEWEDSFGSHLARLRRAAGLTQEQLADRAGLSVRAISSLECGSRHPRRLTLDRLAVALDLTGAQRNGLHDTARYERRRAVPVGTLLPIAGPVGPLVGRRTELVELHAHLTGDGPAALSYDGEAGIGKSRLLAEAVALGARIGMPVLVGIGRRDSDPYSPIADALADHLRRTPPSLLATQLRGCAGLELLLPELADRARPGAFSAAPGAGTAGAGAAGAGAAGAGAAGAGAPNGPGAPGGARGSGGPGQQARRLMFEAVGRFLDNIAGAGRLLLVLDDLHWAGPDTAELLAYLVRRSWPYLRLVTACRAGDVAPGSPLGQCAADLARLRLVRGRRLAPLTGPEADALVGAVAGDKPLPEAARSRITRLSGGLPLFLVELTRAAVDEPAGAEVAAEGVPWHLRLAVVHQLAALPEQVTLLLRRMAVAGPAVPLAQLVTGEHDVELVLDRLDVARRYRILDETRNGFRFRYPLVREVLAGGLGPNRRRLWRSGVSIAAPRSGAPSTPTPRAGTARSADVRHAPVRTA
jgi:transcriptional regulator with XRE-family HTH domain